MSEYIAVAKLSDLKEDTGHVVEVKGRLIALFSKDGSVYAMDDICPHMGASLGSGYVEDGVVTCPWHAWKFNITTGAWLAAPNNCVRTYVIRVEGEEIQIERDW